MPSSAADLIDGLAFVLRYIGPPGFSVQGHNQFIQYFYWILSTQIWLLMVL